MDLALASKIVRLLQWHQDQNARDRYGRLAALYGVAERAVRPVLGALRLSRQMRSSAAEVERREGITPLKQAVTLLPLAARRVPPKEAYLYGLYRPSRTARAESYLWQSRNFELLGRLDRDHQHIWSKLEFHRACRLHGLPDVPILAVVRRREIVAVDGASVDPTDPRWDGELVVKPEVGCAGSSVFGWSRGREALLAHLSSERRPDRSWIVQPCIAGHPALAPISGRGLGTMRLTTYRRADGEIALVFPTLKITVGDAVVDHMRHGNLAAPIDPETGRLGIARTYSTHHVVTAHTRHPDTGIEIVGREVPLWRQAFDLVRHAHGFFPNLFGVGWDVAITEHGPCFIEGNRIFGIELIQVAWDLPIGSTDYGTALIQAVARADPRFVDRV